MTSYSNTLLKERYNGDKVVDFAIVLLSTSSEAVAATKAGPRAAKPFAISVHR